MNMSILQSMTRLARKLGLVLVLVITISCVGKRITKANVESVAEGMSKKQVESILGPPTDIDNKDFVITCDFGGVMFFQSATLIGPLGNFSITCSKIFALCRISSIRTR